MALPAIPPGVALLTDKGGKETVLRNDRVDKNDRDVRLLGAGQCRDQRLLTHDHNDDGVDFLGDGVVELLRLQCRIKWTLHDGHIKARSLGRIGEAAGHAADILIGDRAIEECDTLGTFRPSL